MKGRVNKMAKDVKMFYIEDDIKKVQTKPNLYIQNYNSVGVLHLGNEIFQNAFDECTDPESEGNEIHASFDKMSEMVTGCKLRFSVNKELNSVIVTVVDPQTNQVLKEIPSEDIQKLKLRIRKAIGNLFDEVV